MATHTEPTLLDPQVLELIKNLVAKQMECIAKGSTLRREQQAMGELKKDRDGIIAELARLEVKLHNLELPLGLVLNEKGYVVAEKDGKGGTEE